MRRLLLLAGAAAVAMTPLGAQPYYPQPYPQQPQPYPPQGYARQAYPQQPLNTLDPRDVAQAQREHGEMVRELGGEETGARAAYVRAVGQRIAAVSGIANPRQSVRITLLNSPVENAFSVPGGYVYVTRQLMGLMDNESELAFALGHEIGHVAAHHARAREAYAQRSNVMGVLGQILGAMLGNTIFGSLMSQSAQQASKLRTLSFSRDQEYQADELGMRYLIQSGYDPAGAPEVLAALSRASALQLRMQGRSNRQTPEWASTHPLSENRMQRAQAAAQRTGRIGHGVKNTDQYLAMLKGAYFDDDPAQGIIDGPVFTHPDLKIQFRVPQGYLMSNGTAAVTITGSAGKAQFGGGRYNGSLEQYILEVYRELTGGRSQLSVPPPRRIMINSMPAAVTTARVRTNNNFIDASVVAYQWAPGQVYHFVMLTQGGYGIQPFAQMINSLRRITPAEAAAIKPRVIDVVTTRPGDTVQSLSQRMAYRDFKVERFVALNGISASTPLVPGRKVKLVVYGTRRA